MFELLNCHHVNLALTSSSSRSGCCLVSYKLTVIRRWPLTSIDCWFDPSPCLLCSLMQKMVDVDVNNGVDDGLVLYSARRCSFSVDVRSSRFVFLSSPPLQHKCYGNAHGVFFFSYAWRSNVARCHDPPYGQLLWPPGAKPAVPPHYGK